MSVCVFIAADSPLAPHKPSGEFRMNIDLNCCTVDDGGADDGYFLHEFNDVDIYCSKKYGVEILMDRYTVEKGNQIIEYIRKVLENSISVEIWNVWLLGYWEYEDRPHIHKQTIRIDELTANHIKEIYTAKNWVNGDNIRPWFYGVEIVKS